jgi:hypothetical protein
MNGPTSAGLNWELINKELSEDKITILVTNGFLSAGKVIDSKNVIFLVNDPLIEVALNGDIGDINSDETRNFLEKNYGFDNSHITAFSYDLKSCRILLDSKNIRVAMRSEAICRTIFSDERVIKFNFSFFEKLLIKFSFKWHQDGSNPALLSNRLGIKTFPTESRIAKKYINNKFFAKFWYKLNFCQTPNTFYRALDLALKLDFDEITFVGRNSQIDEWLLKTASDDHIPIEYSYFFADVSIAMKIKNFEAILRELYYSSQYIHMLQLIYPKRKFFSLEKSVCYKDYYSIQYSNMYLK